MVMQVIDFSNIENILFSVIGIIIVVVIIKMFKNMGNKGLGGLLTHERPKTDYLRQFKRQVKKRKKMIVGLGVISVFLLIPFGVNAVGVLSPSSGNVMINTPRSFTTTGLTADTVYTVYYTQGDGSSETLAMNKTSTSAGVYTFSLTFTIEGGANVFVKDITGVTTQVSGSYIVVDYTNRMIPYLMIIVTMSILFGIFAYIIKETKF